MAKDKTKKRIPGVGSIRVNSCWVFHYDGKGCDGCNSEYLCCFSPAWDIERLGFRNTGNPAYADVLLITGLIDRKCKRELLEIYRQMQDGCKVVAVGSCASTGGMFSQCDGIIPGVDTVIPVDIYATGCAVRPEALIDALIKARDLERPERGSKEGSDD